MRWSVSVVAEGDRVMSREEIVELADAVAASSGIASGIGTTSYGAQLVVEADDRDEAVELAVGRVRAGRGAGRPAAVAGRRRRDDRRGRRRCDEAPMIRLGSLAGYPFEGPRVLAGWTPPAAPAVYAIVVQARAGHQARAVRRHLRRPLRRPVHRAVPVPATRGRRAGCGGPATGGSSTSARTRCPGGLRSHREQIARELTAIYHPSCNTEQYDQAWKDEWIGEYTRADRPARSPPAATPRRGWRRRTLRIRAPARRRRRRVEPAGGR